MDLLDKIEAINHYPKKYKVLYDGNHILNLGLSSDKTALQGKIKSGNVFSRSVTDDISLGIPVTFEINGCWENCVKNQMLEMITNGCQFYELTGIQNFDPQKVEFNAIR